MILQDRFTRLYFYPKIETGKIYKEKYIMYI